MAYQALSKVSVGQLFTKSMYDVIRENFAQGIPGKYTAKGQLLAATGNQASGIIAPTANGQSLIVDLAEATGLKFVGGTVPIGVIILWSGSVASIPSGWQLCDGTNGTPDLRGKFVVGAGNTYAVGANGSGGGTVNLTHTHTTNAVTSDANSSSFSHAHSQGNTGYESSHTHTVSGSITGSTFPIGGVSSTDNVNKAVYTHGHSVSGSVGSGTQHRHTNPVSNYDGGSHTHSIASINTTGDVLTSVTLMPDYYALCYIQRIT